MKLAHIADAHLGIRQYSRQTPNGINQRETDVANAFRAVVDGVIAERPDVVVVAGDLFHSVRPTNSAIVFAFRQFQRLREALPEAPIVLIAGNHDTPRSAETGSILGLFRELMIDVAVEKAHRFVYPQLDLSVFAVPHQALVSGERPALRPDGPERNQVLVIHGEYEGVIQRGLEEYGGAIISAEDLGAGDWSYVAFGHYHVRLQIAGRAWYAGSLEYVSPSMWAELREEAMYRIGGKSWLLVDLDTGSVSPQSVPLARRLLDLPPIDAGGKSAEELDVEIADRVGEVAGGIDGQIVRLVVHEIPRHVARGLNHTALRAFKSAALHFHLDLRRPEAHRESGFGAPGRRRTLPEIVRDYLERRPLTAEIDRARFVAAGTELMESVDRDLAGI